MKTVLIIGYFLVPALVYFTAGYAERGFHALDASTLQWFIPNYLIFAAPQLLWAILSLLFKFSPPVTHAGYLAATVALLSLHIWFECCTDNRNAMGWLMYWPLALMLMAFSAALIAKWWRPNK